MNKYKSAKYLYLVILSISVTLIFPGSLWAEEKKERPNIVLVVVNALRADHLRSYGYGRSTAPGIDALAGDAYLFENAFAQAGYTMPSMMSLFTSLYPDSHGVYDAFKDKLPETKLKTMAELLQQNGYRTGWFALLGLGHLSQEAGFGRGFSYQGQLGIQLEGRDEMLEWVGGKGKGPFFLAVHVRHSHRPYITLPQYRLAFKEGGVELPFMTMEDFKEAVYLGFVKGLFDKKSPIFGLIDKRKREKEKNLLNGKYAPGKLEKITDLVDSGRRYRIGKLQNDTFYEHVRGQGHNGKVNMVSMYDASILATDQEVIKPLVNLLKEKGIYDETMIIINSDHGDSFGEHNMLGPGPIPYENLIHVPLVIKVPGSTKGGIRISSLVQGIDLMPTVLETAGIAPPGYIQGKSLVSVMAGGGKKPVHEYVFGESRGFAYIRNHKWKVIIDRGDQDKLWLRGRLFDLQKDSGELSNVKEESPQVFSKLMSKLLEHLEVLPDLSGDKNEFMPDIDEKTRRRIKKTGYW